MVGDFGERRAGVEGEVGEFLNLLGLSARAEDEQPTSEADSKNHQDDECDKEFCHGWGHGAAAARVVSDDEFGDDCHC